MPIRKSRWLLTFVLLAVTAWSAVFVFPKPEGVLTDKAGIFDETQRSSLIQTIERTAEKTGTQIALLTADASQGLSADTFAAEVMDKWPHRENALLLVWIAENGALALRPSEGLQANIDIGALKGIADAKKHAETPDRIVTDVLDAFAAQIRRSRNAGDIEEVKTYLQNTIKYMLLGAIAVALLYRYLPIEGRYMRAAVIALGAGIVAGWALHDARMGSLTFAVVFGLLVFSRRYLWWGMGPTIAEGGFDLDASDGGDAGGGDAGGGDAS